MNAIRFHQHGDPSVFVYEEVAEPRPGPGEVLIQVAAAGVNYADLMQRQGVYPLSGSLPAILGFEVAGTVVAHGEGVTEPAIGTRVLTGLGGGGYAKYAVAPAVAVAPIPANLGFPEAAALFLQGLIAYGLLRDAGRIQSGESVLIHSAAGGVGSLAIQLAKLLGAGKVIGTASTAAKLDLIRQIGADEAVNYSEPGWVEQVQTATGGQGVDLVLDAVGGEIGAQSLALLGRGGRLVVYGAASGQPTIISAQQLSAKGQSVIGYSLGTRMTPEQMASGLRDLLGYVAEGRLQLIVGQTYALRDAALAHLAMAERKTTGKVVLLV